jgi:hypothetical protein
MILIALPDALQRPAKPFADASAHDPLEILVLQPRALRRFGVPDMDLRIDDGHGLLLHERG